jgi:processive 1,2-diacylglycerol beta-glucosyltransferase
VRSSGLNRLFHHWDEAVFGEFELTRPSETRVYKERKLKRILVLSVSAGAGHVRAAEAIVAHARADFPQLSVRHLDVMQVVPKLFKQIYAELYIKLASGLPEAWGWLYRKTDREPKGSLTEKARRGLQQLCSQRLYDEIDQFGPDAIVCTHFLPAEILATAAAQRRINCPVWVQVTDFDLHHMWLHDGVAGYFVANEELAFRLSSFGVSNDRITIGGIPVMPGFVTHPSRTLTAQRLGFDPSRTTLLMMGGGAGAGMQEKLVNDLMTQHPELQLIVMTGRNQRLLNSLQALQTSYPERLRPIGFTDEVPALMACADLAITKPGGLSTSECLVMGLPMLLINPIPGQEERNAAYLIQEGAALRADDPATLQFRLNRLLKDKEALARMRSRALALGTPRAAHAVLERVV